MKQLLTFAGFCYVSFALLIATQSLASLKATTARNTGQRILVDPAQPTLFDHERLDNSGKKAEIDKANYTVEVWTASWCGPCRAYKRREVPALLKAGFKVKVLDYDRDNPPKEVKKVPTVRLYYKGTLLQSKTYWKAKDIAKYVDNHLSLKG